MTNNRKNKRNYYRILHVQPDAPKALIRSSYRTIMQKLRKHPDLGGEEWDAAVINEAYEVLFDDTRRREYDAVFLAARGSASAGQQNASQRSTEKPEPSSSHSSNHSSSQNQSSVNRQCYFCAKSYNGIADSKSRCEQCASPLQRVKPTELEQGDQRKIQRVSKLSALQLTAKWLTSPVSASLNNFSLNGLRFDCDTTLLIGQFVRLECAEFLAVAEVMNHAADGDCTGYGARFITLHFNDSSGTFVSVAV